MHDLAIVIVSTNEAHWIAPCLETVYAQAGPIALDVVVADNGSTDGTAEAVSRFPGARVVRCENHGFSHANNRAMMTCDARYVLLLNPDTEVREGTFADLVAAMDARPDVGFASVRQVLPDGTLFPTIRRFPSPLRRVRRGARLRALGPRRRGARRARAGARALRARDRRRLADRRVHAPAPRGARGGRLARRALLHVLRGDRPLLPREGGGLRVVPPAVDDDPPPRRQARDEPADGRAVRVRAAAVRRASTSPPAPAPRTSRRSACATACAPSARTVPPRSTATARCGGSRRSCRSRR